MEDFFWRYIVLYLIPPLALMASSAPDIQVIPGIVVYAEYRQERRVFALTWMIMAIAILFPVHYFLLARPMDGSMYIPVDIFWGIVYLAFAWKMGPYLGD